MNSVLICDNDPAVRTSVKNKLEELGIEAIYECCDGTSAVSLAREGLPDIAIIDAGNPQNNGLSAAREIRQKQKIPVVLLTSQCDSETLNRAKKIGITSILTKPFRAQDLLPALEMAFTHAQEVELLKEQVGDLENTIESQKIIYKAKKVLQRSEGLSESEAFRKIQKLAMDKQRSMRQIAELFLSTEQVQAEVGDYNESIITELSVFGG